MLEIEVYGRRKKLLKQLTQMKKDHAKIADEKYKKEKFVSKDGVKDLLKSW